MPDLNWEKISEIKHALAQERTIICGVIMRLERLCVKDTIDKLKLCDKRLSILEAQLVEVINVSGKQNENTNGYSTSF